MEVTSTLKLFSEYNLTVVVIGLGVLALSTLLHRFKNYPFSFPMVALVVHGIAATPVMHFRERRLQRE